MDIYLLVPLVLLACGISFFIGWFLNQKSGQNKITSAQDRAAKIISDAEKEVETLKREKLVLDWKKWQTTRASVRLTIETMLDQLPRAYTREVYAQKCDLVYQHIFDSYAGLGRSLYATN